MCHSLQQSLCSYLWSPSTLLITVSVDATTTDTLVHPLINRKRLHFSASPSTALKLHFTLIPPTFTLILEAVNQHPRQTRKTEKMLMQQRKFTCAIKGVCWQRKVSACSHRYNGYLSSIEMSLLSGVPCVRLSHAYPNTYLYAMLFPIFLIFSPFFFFFYFF